MAVENLAGEAAVSSCRIDKMSWLLVHASRMQVRWDADFGWGGRLERRRNAGAGTGEAWGRGGHPVGANGRIRL